MAKRVALPIFFQASHWPAASATRTSSARRPRGRNRAPRSLDCRWIHSSESFHSFITRRMSCRNRCASWRSGSTSKNIWRRPNGRRWPNSSKWPTPRSRPGSRTGAPNGGKSSTLFCPLCSVDGYIGGGFLFSHVDIEWSSVVTWRWTVLQSHFFLRYDEGQHLESDAIGSFIGQWRREGGPVFSRVFPTKRRRGKKKQ